MKKLSFLTLVLAAAPLLAAEPIQHWQTERGSRVYLVERHEVPIIDISIDIDAGEARSSEPGEATLAMRALLAKMPERFGEKTIEQTLWESGSAIDAHVSAGRARLTIRLDRNAGLESLVATDIGRQLGEAHYPNELLRPRRQALAQEMPAREKDFDAGERFWLAANDQHPYRTSALRTFDTVDDLSNMQLRRFQRKFYTPANVSVTLVGDITRERATHLADALTRYLPDGPQAPALPPLTSSVKPEKPVEVRTVKPQKEVRIGLATPFDGNLGDLAALEMADYMLGGSDFSSRLFKAIRGDHGLSYYASSSLNVMRSGLVWSMQAGTQAGQVDELQRRMQAEFDRFWQDGPTEAEFQIMQRQYLRAADLWGATNSGKLNMVARNAFMNRPTDYHEQLKAKIADLDVKTVHETFRRYFRPEMLVTVLER
ncbi:M16 family metallopeptidase [Chitinibacteraceae bacterium HSL-7]